MVDKETIELDAATLQMLVVGGRAARGLNGEWTVILQLDGDINIDAERALPIRREIHVKTRQQGRKSNPARNWGKGGFKMKVRGIRVHRQRDEIEFKRSDGLWYPMPSEWTFDRKGREFVYRQGTDRETRYPLSQQHDTEYLYGDLPISPHGEILIG